MYVYITFFFREALRRFGANGLANQMHCRKAENGVEDLEMGFCMMKCGVLAGDSRDVKVLKFLEFFKKKNKI